MKNLFTRKTYHLNKHFRKMKRNRLVSNFFNDYSGEMNIYLAYPDPVDLLSSQKRAINNTMLMDRYIESSSAREEYGMATEQIEEILSDE